MQEGSENKKKYTIVDKRFEDDETAGPAEEAAAGAKPDRPAEAAPESVTGRAGSEDGATGEGEGQADEKAAVPGMAGALRAVMGMLRERALLSMGLILSGKRPKTPDMDQAREIAALFGKMTDAFAGRLGPDELGEEGSRIPTMEQTMDFCFNVVQGQVYISLGLIPDPSSGLVARDLGQARLGIDFCAALLENGGSFLGPEAKRAMETHLSNMRIQYVTVLKQPS